MVSPSLITPFALAFISFLKGSDEFKLEEVIAEFERKGIDEKYYKDLGEEGKVKNDAVFQEYKLKKQKEFLSEFRALASTDVMSMFAFNNISKLLSLVFFRPLSLSPSQSLGLTGNFEPRIIAYSKTKSK
jgi:hypothetical protein